MSFAAPLFIVALIALAAIWAAWKYGARVQARTASLFGGETEASARKAALAVAAAIVLVVFALMQPLIGNRAEEAPQTGRDIVVLLDTSLSMQAEDMTPNRLEAAKRAIAGLADAVAIGGGHRLGLLAFSGRATMLSPLTLDYGLFRDRLEAAETGLVDLEGSALADAMLQARDRLTSFRPGFTDMILVSDGEDHGGLPLDGTRAAADAGIDVYTLAIGVPGTGAAIPLITADGTRTTAMFDGFPVQSRVQETLLQDMAEAANGAYLGVMTDASVLARHFDEVLADKPKDDLDLISNDVPAHRFQWPLLIAFALLAVAFALNRRRERGWA
ncbi:MAG: VWA domain-containing protein [Pseudomonadota bacterium]